MEIKLTITLSANAGIAIKTENKTIWVDAIHKKKSPGYSTVSPCVYEKLFTEENFKNPDVLCFTHRHSDHFSSELLREALEKCPDAVAAVPDKNGMVFIGNTERISGMEKYASRSKEKDRVLRVKSEDISFFVDDISFSFFRTVHMGELYKEHVHDSIIIKIPENTESSEKTILIAGDAALTDDGLADIIFRENIKPDLAILPYPWISVSHGRKLLEEKIRPQKVLITHLPYEEDDTEGYLASALRMKDKLPYKDKIYMLYKPLESAEITV